MRDSHTEVFWKKTRVYYILLILLIVTLLGFASPVIVLLLYVTFIGIPIALFIQISSIILFLYAGALVGGGIWNWRGAFVGALTVLSGLYFATLKPNSQLESRAKEYIAGDHNSLGGPLKVQVIGLRYIDPWQLPPGQFAACNNFCMRALLNGDIKRVILLPSKDLNAFFDPNVSAISYRLERRGQCNPGRILDGGYDARIPDEQNWGSGRLSPADVMNLRISRGECLVDELVQSGTAEAVIFSGALKNGTTPFDAGMDRYADTLFAGRQTVHVRDGTGYREVYRRTNVTTYPLWPVFAPTQVSGYGLSVKSGLMRRKLQYNAADEFNETPDFGQFVTETLGIKLSLRNQGDAAANLLKEMIDEVQTVLDRNVVNADQVFDILNRIRLRAAQDGKAPEEGRALLLRVLQDHRISLPPGLAALARTGGAAKPEWMHQLLVAAFDRLESLRGKSSGLTGKELDTAAVAGDIIAQSPRGSLEPFFDRLNDLAGERVARLVAYMALARLSDFGPRGGLALLALLDSTTAPLVAARAGRVQFGNDVQHPYLGAMIGLCMGGEKLGPILPEFASRANRGGILFGGPYGRLALHTAVALGADDVWLEEFFRQHDPSFQQSNFKSVLSGARSKVACYY